VERARRFLNRLIMSVLILQGISLVLIIGISVFFRYVVGAALSWPDEVAGIIFVWYTLLGIVVLVGSESHIAFDLIGNYAPPFISKSIKLLSQCIILLYGAIMAVYGWKYFQLFPDETSPAAGIDLSYLKIAIPVTGVLVVAYVILNIINAFKRSSPLAAEKEGA
jgi:TRAP-type C4-dicarboxylate transport system permease small subunit